MKVRVWLGVFSALTLSVGCSEEEPPLQPGSFDRPTRIALACFDVQDELSPRTLALDACDPSSEEYERVVREQMAEPLLHALVVQSSRGEVAAVDVLNRRTLDSREDIPGYTFLPVGELPTAIAVPARAGNSAFTYVLGAGSRDVTVLRTRAFRSLGARESPVLQTAALPGDPQDAPYDMVLSPDEDALFVSVPDSGRLLRLPIQRCGEADAGTDCMEGRIDVAGITEVSLSESVALAMMSMPGEPPAGGPYAQVCDYPGSVSNMALPLPPLPPDAAMTAPRPMGLAVDSFCERGTTCRPRLLVADEALPMIHVLDLDAWTETSSDDALQPPIQTGAPTVALAVTPRVPIETAPESGETQYVYAIDARDGSVLVTENGRLLDVGATGARPDRVTLGTAQSEPVAVSLGVMTPAFDVYGPAAQYAEYVSGSRRPEQGNFCTDTAHPRRQNTRLRGVFVAVGVADGTVRVVDVHDMDLAECRRCDKGSGPSATWDPYPVVRHRPRIAPTASEQATSVPLAPIARPVFAIEGDLLGVRVTGTTSDPRLRGLDCVTCPEGQRAAFPELAGTGGLPDAGTSDDAGAPESADETTCGPGQARVCALADPWAELDDWAAVYRGVLPGTRGGDARLDLSGDRPQLMAATDFCQWGVLGEEQLDDRAGDHLVIVGELAPDSAIRATPPHDGDPDSNDGRLFENSVLETCRALVRERDSGTPRVPIAFPIRASYADRLVLSPNLVARDVERSPLFDNDAQLIQKCFGGMPLRYEVRVGEGFAVLGSSTGGFLHGVAAEEGTGRCFVDPSQSPTRTGRAYANQPFDNGFVTFQLRPVSAQLTPVDTALLLNLDSTTDKVAMNATISLNDSVLAAVPVDLRWSDVDDTLYVVDVASRGLLQVPVDPFPLAGVTRSIQ